MPGPGASSRHLFRVRRASGQDLHVHRQIVGAGLDEIGQEEVWSEIIRCTSSGSLVLRRMASTAAAPKLTLGAEMPRPSRRRGSCPRPPPPPPQPAVPTGQSPRSDRSSNPHGHGLAPGPSMVPACRQKLPAGGLNVAAALHALGHRDAGLLQNVGEGRCLAVRRRPPGRASATRFMWNQVHMQEHALQQAARLRACADPALTPAMSIYSKLTAAGALG